MLASQMKHSDQSIGKNCRSTQCSLGRASYGEKQLKAASKQSGVSGMEKQTTREGGIHPNKREKGEREREIHEHSSII
ncbi:hypothetical protein PFISCL1PPCAC_26064, partial [Pristionchus fissidentatus]